MIISYKNFYKVDVYEERLPHIRLWVMLPRKTIFINRAAERDANIVRVGWDANDDLLRLPSED